VVLVQQQLGVSERRACRVLGQARSTQRSRVKGKEGEEALTSDIVKLADRLGRYGLFPAIRNSPHRQSEIPPP